MFKKQNLFHLAFFSFYYVSMAFSQSFNLEVKKIEEIEDNIIFKVDQDKQGFLWIASKENLSKYDGENLTSFSLKELDLMPFTRIDVIPDANGDIWYYSVYDFQIRILNTQTGKINYFRDKFKKLPFAEADLIDVLYRDKDYNIYITVKGKGLYKYDGEKLSLFQEVLDSEEDHISFYTSGLYDFIAYGKKIIKINKESLQKQTISSPYIVKYITDFKGETIFVTQKGIRSYDFFMFHLKGNELVDYLPDFNLHNFYSISFITHQNNFANEFGLNLKDRLAFINDEKKVVFEIDKSKYFSVNSYNGFFRDKSNNVWLATSEGLYKATPFEKKVRNYLKEYSLRSIVKKDSILYVGTYKGGLSTISPKGVESYVQIFNDSILNAKGLLLVKDALWMSVDSKVFRYSFKTNTQSVIKDNIDYDNRGYNSLGRHPKTKTIFVGSYFRLNKVDNTKTKIIPLDEYFKAFISETEKIDVRCFKEEGNTLWIGTSKGLFLMNENEEIVKWIGENEGLPNILIQHIYIEDKNTIWLATNGNGIIKWDREKNSFKTYTQREGLSNNNVYAVYKDEFGFFWLPTDNGLNRFAPKTLNNKILFPKDGLTNKEFNYMSHFQDEKGLLYFGGISGLNEINPKDFFKNETEDDPEYKIIINSLNILNDESLIVDNKDKLLQDNKINLTSNPSYLELKFSIMDFLNNPPLQSLYKIEPLHNEYILVENNAISLSNLEPGEYELHIKVQSNNGKWTTLKKSILVELDSAYINALTFIIVLIIILYAFIDILKLELRAKRIRKSHNVVDITPQKKDLSTKTETQLLEKNATIENNVNAKYILWLKEFDTLILNNIDSFNFSIEFLSQELNISERQLHRRIKRLTGKTPNKYITEIKLKEAYCLIKEGKVKSVNELSKKVGYSTTDYFSKLFKDRFKKSPSDLMKF